MKQRYIKQLAGKLIAEGLTPSVTKKEALNAIKNTVGRNFLTEIINTRLNDVKKEMQIINSPLKK